MILLILQKILNQTKEKIANMKKIKKDKLDLRIISYKSKYSNKTQTKTTKISMKMTVDNY